MTYATALAHPNIALVKYWGKRDETLSLPATGSLSVTLDILPTTTTVEVDGSLRSDAFALDGATASPAALERVSRFLDLVRERAGDDRHAIVRSTNEVPTGAGLASSAAGFAALATAAAAAYGLRLDERERSRLARRGSGSAARSIVSGVSVWHAGDDAASFAEPVEAPPLALVLATVDAGEKPVPSRQAMRQSVATSPFFAAWVDDAERTLEAMLAASAAGDLETMGRLTERNAMRMHAVIQSNDPPVRYLTGASLAVLDRVQRLRDEGVVAHATADAGPNLAVLCAPGDAQSVADAIADVASVAIAHPGPGARLLAAEVAA